MASFNWSGFKTQWLCQTLHIYRVYTHIQISTEKVFETVGLVGLILIRLTSSS